MPARRAWACVKVAGTPSRGSSPDRSVARATPTILYTHDGGVGGSLRMSWGGWPISAAVTRCRYHARMNRDEIVDRIRELRSKGATPKAIARAVGLPPSQVTPLLRALAEENEVGAAQRQLLGCWVNPGWSNGLTVDRSEERRVGKEGRSRW